MSASSPSSSSATTAAAFHYFSTLFSKYPKRPSTVYTYGTAGFRFEIDPKFAPTIFFRTGLLACIRSQFLNGKPVGLCVTASHNPQRDNGVKLIDPDGGMLQASWESIAAKVANCESDLECWEILQGLVGSEKVGKGAGVVVVGRDTRIHSEKLEAAAMEGIECLNGLVERLGVVTTPQVHFCVLQKNGLGYLNYPASLLGYQNCLVESYGSLVQGTKPLETVIRVDCANGVGAVQFPSILKELKEKAHFNCELFGTEVDVPEKLNENCGAEHVQKSQTPPVGLQAKENERYASFDGDADRIVFYSFKHGTFRLFDGDKIASLIALFVQKQIKFLPELQNANIGTVQTAYANGASTEYLKNTLQVHVPCVKTGVKHLHHSALEFDVGIYFEANGHGTALFRPSFVERLRNCNVSSPESKLAQKRLIALAELLNQATGDAFTDLLAVDGILRVLEMNDDHWASLYVDLPSKQCKVKVADRTVVETTQDETRCVRPQALQDRLDEAVKSIPSGRVFVRPSGTEDVIRVYAEANTQENANLLAEEATEGICDQAGGIRETKRVKETH
jgi:phosphoacetylglucosamine mutase